MAKGKGGGMTDSEFDLWLKKQGIGYGEPGKEESLKGKI